MISKSQLHFVSRLPENLDFKQCILLFDSVLHRKNSSWIKKFPHRYGLRSGEQLKDVKYFPNHIEHILKLSAGLSRSDMTVVAFGGGSVGDFAGFVASVLKRGVRFVQIPSTWLSAMDSAHGGKTALNVGRIKNQIGSFYSAESVYLVKKVLLSQPAERAEEALGEYYKMALIEGGKLWKAARSTSRVSANVLWQNLPAVIEAKLKIVRRDPYEKKAIRFILNLGHTVGHVLEAELGMAHGRAVLGGLLFSLNWGQQLGVWQYGASVPEWMLPERKEFSLALRKASKNSANKIRRLLVQDKKMAGNGKMNFVFVKRPGQAVIKSVSVEELVKEWQRQQG